MFFAGLVMLVAVGAWHQDRKLLARRGAPYGDYLASTSAIPLAAVLSGRQRLTWQDVPIGTLALGLGLALSLRHWHAMLFANRGAGIVGVVLAGALVAGLGALRRSRRLPAPAPIDGGGAGLDGLRATRADRG